MEGGKFPMPYPMEGGKKYSRRLKTSLPGLAQVRIALSGTRKYQAPCLILYWSSYLIPTSTHPQDSLEEEQYKNLKNK